MEAQHTTPMVRYATGNAVGTTVRGTVPRWGLAAICVGLAGCLAVVATWFTFSNTYDEPAHVASGMEWLSEGRYEYEALHPPLARVFTALGPYSVGMRSTGARNIWTEGRRLLGGPDRYRRTLALARAGILPFFVLLLATVWVWGRRELAGPGAALALTFVVTNPNILAHAGLATTDIAATAFMIAALLAYLRWVERPSLGRTLWLAAACALTLLSKFSAASFLGLTLIASEAIRIAVARPKDGGSTPVSRWRPAGATADMHVARNLAAAALFGLLIIWAGYRFSVGPVSGSGTPVPAPELVRGIRLVAQYTKQDFAAFLLGESKMGSWWYYFPVAVLVKSPLPLLVAAVPGIAVLFRDGRPWRDRHAELVPVIGVVAVMGIAMTGNMNLGIRHVLPIYPLLALLAARGVLALWTANASKVTRAAAVLVTAVAVVIPIRAHPDHIAYFNVLAGPEPQNVLSDSNLDWGQDLYRLADVVRRRGIDRINVAYFGSANLRSAGIPNPHVFRPEERPTGWVAASETLLAGVFVGDAYKWLLRYEPVERVGPSMRLYYVPPSESGAAGTRR